MKSKDTMHKSTSPFLESQNLVSLEEEVGFDAESAAPYDFALETPFINEHQVFEGTEEPADPRQTELTALMSELYDEEFNEEMYQLAAEAADYFRSRVPETDPGNGGLAERQAQQELEEHFAPVQEDLEIILENMIAEVDEVELESMSDEEKDLWVESFFSEEPELEGEGPEVEHSRRSRKQRRKRRKERRKRRWSGIKRKIKKVVKKVGKKIGKQALKVMLRRLAKVAKKLLNQVLQAGGKHLPTRYRPLFDMLRKRLLKKEHTDDEALGEWLSGGMAPLQNELDFHLASALLEGKESAPGMESELDYLSEEEGPSQSLDEAREMFVEQLLSLEENDDPTPQVEQFVTAILQAIRFVAKPIIAAVGRDKVIKFLAKYVARITGKFIKKKNLNTLVSTALVDVGLRLMRLEVEPEDEREAAAEALAGVVEDTVRSSLQLPASVFADEELLEAEVMVAFEQAAADNLPPILSEEAYRQRPHLRPSGNTKNAWVRLPLRKRGRRRLNRRLRRYKKAIRPLRRRISAHAAKEVMSFGEVPLESFLDEQMGIDIGGGVEAEIHLYEALPETELFDIASQESYVPGLRGGHAFGYAMLHPLTIQAAGLLLGEPTLGRNVPASYLSDRHRICAGQRFYYLEIPGAQPQTALEEGFLRLRRPSTTELRLDFIAREVEITFFLSEKAAQNIAVGLKAARSRPGALARAAGILSDGLRRSFSPVAQNKFRIAHPEVMPGALSGHAMRRVPPYVTELLASRLEDWARGALSRGLGTQAERFVAATQHPEDGVTLRIKLVAAPGLPEVGKILSNSLVRIPVHLFEGTPDSTRLEIQPGYRHG